MPGPRLTVTDVSQRFAAFLMEPNRRYFPSEELEAGCLAIYEREKREGTKLGAILGLLREHVHREEEHLRNERHERQLLSGADCKWIKLQNSPHWHRRTNGRLYRLSPTKDKKWDLYRVQTVYDEEPLALLDTYQNRRGATKAVGELAYLPEPER